MTFGKRQLVIAALVAALGTAVYLNWQLSGAVPAETTGSSRVSEKQLGQTTYVNTSAVTPESSSAASKKTDSQGSSDVKTVNASSEKAGKFEKDRKSRSESNASAIEALNDIVEAAASSESAKKEAVEAAKELAKIIKLQTDLEAQIRAKGFDDAFVSVNNGSCIVSVSGGKLDEAAAIAIKDMVNRQAGIDFQKITVAPVV